MAIFEPLEGGVEHTRVHSGKVSIPNGTAQEYYTLEYCWAEKLVFTPFPRRGKGHFGCIFDGFLVFGLLLEPFGVSFVHPSDKGFNYSCSGASPEVP